MIKWMYRWIRGTLYRARIEKCDAHNNRVNIRLQEFSEGDIFTMPKKQFEKNKDMLNRMNIRVVKTVRFPYFSKRAWLLYFLTRKWLYTDFVKLEYLGDDKSMSCFKKREKPLYTIEEILERNGIKYNITEPSDSILIKDDDDGMVHIFRINDNMFDNVEETEAVKIR